MATTDNVDADISSTDNMTLPEDGAIKIEYHPSSGQHGGVLTPGGTMGTALPGDAPPVDPEPWAPFNAREDFEFAELALETGMSKKQVNSLIKLFHKCIGDGKDSFTLSNYDDMHKKLGVASECLPKVCSWHCSVNILWGLVQAEPEPNPKEYYAPCSNTSDLILFKFEKETISATSKNQSHEFDVWVRPMWPWIQDMLQNPDLIHHFVWDACKMSRFSKESDSWVRFYDEPWTADRFWEIQVCVIDFLPHI